jgi:protocatechuate 3,4-dioxygenase beta subunit
MGLPVAGTTIALYDYWSTGSGLRRHYLTEQVTGPKGDFSFDVRKGIYSLEVIPNRDTRFARQSIETIKVSNNTTLTVQIKNGCLVTGKVRTAAGEVSGDCELLFFGVEPEPVRATEQVGSDGSFSISLPKGRYEVACRCLNGVSSNSGLTPAATGKRPSSTAFLSTTMTVLDVERDLRGEDMVLPEMVPFKGTVTNPEGHPVADVKVTVRKTQPEDGIYAAEAALVGICNTNKAGQFECFVEPGLYDVRLEPGPGSHLSERQVSSILVDQARSRTYSLGAGYRLAGTVTFNDEPVKNALVTVHGAKTDSSVLTDDEGNYAFALSGGKYVVSVTAQPDSLARLPFRLLSPFSCELKLAEDTVRDVSLVEGVSVSGTVTDGSGNPRPGVQLALFLDTGGGVDTTSGAQRALTFGITGDDGSYEFRVAPNKYWLVVNNQQSTAKAFETADSDVQGDIQWHSGCMVEFDIVSEFDEPISNCQVVCESYAAGASAASEMLQGSSNEVGSCRMSMPAGIYSFRFEPPAHGSFQPKMIRQLSVSSDVRRKVKLSPKSVAAQPSG